MQSKKLKDLRSSFDKRSKSITKSQSITCSSFSTYNDYIDIHGDNNSSLENDSLIIDCLDKPEDGDNFRTKGRHLFSF